MNKTMYILIGIVLFILITSRTIKDKIEPVDLMSKDENIKFIDNKLKDWGITSRSARIGILAVIGKESGYVPKYETGYSNTSNSRIRQIFPTKTKGISDLQLTNLKKSDFTFFNFIYDGILGNMTGSDDGYIYRGSGFNQLTGRSNYEAMAKKTGVNLVDNPELNNTINVATDTMLHFMQSGWQSAQGKAKLKAKGYNRINDITDNDFAVRFFCNINAGIGNDMNSTKVNNAVNNAKPYQKSLEKIIL